MDYIISPWFFYLVSLFYKLSVVLSIILIISIICVAGLILATIFDILEIGSVEKAYQQFKKPLMALIVVLVICGMLYMVIPDKETMYVMQASKFVTEGNIEKVGKTLQDGVDSIIEAIQEYEEE